jgi:Alpha/beta hydrolase family
MYGLLGEIFTPGISKVAEKLREHGAIVEVGSWIQSSGFAAEACAHRHDRLIIVGHSLGAVEAARVTTEARSCGARDVTMVAIDPPPTAVSVPGGARAVNFVGVLHGTIAGARNVPIKGYGHIAIVDNSAMQQRIVTTALSLSR